MNTMEVFVSRDVVFHEKFFPFNDIKNRAIRTDPFEDSHIPTHVPNVIPVPHSEDEGNENCEESTPAHNA